MSLALNSSSSYITTKFDPRNIGLCVLWLDAGDVSTLTPNNPSSGTTITGWRDKSGFGNHVTSVVGTNTYSTLSNGYPAINFNNTGGYRGALASGTTITTGVLSVFAVAQVSNTVSNSRIVSLATTGTNDTSSVSTCAALRRNGTTAAVHSFRNGVSLSNVAISYDTATVLSCVYDGGINRVYANGTQGTQPASGSNFSSTLYGVGIEGLNLTTEYLAGRIAEVLIFNALLSTTERQLIEGYLANKWGLNTSLTRTTTSLHPYYYGTKLFSRYFNPIDLRDCIIWIDASDKTTVPTSGSTVTGLTNKSDLTTSITTYGSPTWSATGLNNLPAIDLTNGRFIGQFLTTSGNVLTRYVYTAFIVGSMTTAPTAGYPLMALSESANGTTVFLRILDYATSTFRTVGFFAAVTIASSASVTNTQFLWRSSYASTGNNSLISSSRNGVAVTTGNVGTQPTTTPTHFMIGTDGFTGQTTTNTWPGKVSEILLFNRLLSTQEVQVIEGYLAWKWDLDASLPTTHSYYSTVNRPRRLNVNPSFLNDTLTYWIDSADTGALTKTGTTLNTWLNKAGYGTNSNLAPSAGNTNTVTIGASLINGLPIVNIPARSALSTTSFTFGSQSFSIIFVINITSFVSGYSLRVVNNASGGWQPYLLLSNLNTNPWNITIGSTNSTPLVGSVSSSFATGTTYLISAVLSTSSTNNRVAVNGTLRTLTTSANSILTTNTPVAYTIGQVAGDLIDINWNLPELLIFNAALSDGNRKQVEGYLAWKWGIQSNLPSTHPFAKIRP